MFRRISFALLFTVAIPIVGFLIAFGILASLEITPEIIQFCSLENVRSDAEFRAGCNELRQIVLLRDGSVWTGAVAVGLILVYVLASFATGRSRGRNAAIFPVLVPLSLLVIVGLVLVEGAILTYGLYIGQVYAIERVFIWLVGLVGLGAVVGAFGLIRATFSIKRTLTHTAFARQMDSSVAPKLIDFVGGIAESIGAKKPDNIVVGLEPNFYATAAKLILVGQEKSLTGESLYLSLPLMRLLNVNELRAVIGHELGHFKGADVAYSLKFAPVYRGLSHAIISLSDEEGGISSLAKLPAVSMLSLMLELFSRNERRISREREFEADKAGVSVSSPEALAIALGKVAIYSPLWGVVRDRNIDRLNDGKITANLSQVFEDSTRFDVSHRAVGELIDEISETRIAHPTDTHPPMGERFANIGFDSDDLTIDLLTDSSEQSVSVLDDMSSTEEALTLDEHRLMVAFGRVEPPDEDEERQVDTLLNALYALAAAMVGADGKVVQSEVAAAEAIGSQMFTNFDQVDFRECCNNLGDLPAFRDVVDILAAPLTSESRSQIYDYLKEIAMADNELADEEKELLLYAREKWEIEI